MGRRKKIDTHAVREEVVTAMRSQTPSEREQRIILLWNRWIQAKEFLKKTRTELKDRVKAAEAYLDDAMETGIAVGDDDAAKRKLHSIEVNWQDLAEARAAYKDGVAGARDGVGGALAALRELIEATQQLDLEFAKAADEADERAEKRKARRSKKGAESTEETPAETSNDFAGNATSNEVEEGGVAQEA